MQTGKAGSSTSALDETRDQGRIVGSTAHLGGLWHALKGNAGLLLPLVSIGALIAGVGAGSVSGPLSASVMSIANAFIDGYSYGAPVLIFIVLAPVLSRIFSTRQRGKFGLYVVGWLSVTKILALLWAVAFTVTVFQLPLVSDSSVSLGSALSQTGRTLLITLTTSQFFWAIYAAIVTGAVAIKVKSLARILEQGVTFIEHAGQYIQPLIPLFMFAVGVYVQSLPGTLAEQIGLEGTLSRFHTVDILGYRVDPNTSSGMVTAYVIGALLVAVASFAWHFAILALTMHREKRFSLRDYVTNYWLKTYPLLWATSSESLATPLNLYILSKRAPWVRPTVRRIVIGAGSVLCTNGTLISVFILLGLVGSMVGVRFSLIELLMSIPVAFLISFGIPGIPGELFLFAGPLAMILGIPPEVVPIFLALYLGLQIGLPDSFRTGANTTNNYLYAILLNRTYEERFVREEP